MLAYIAFLLSLSALVLANPIVIRDDQDPLNGTCKDTMNSPTEEQYIIGYNNFCDLYVKHPGPRPDHYHLLKNPLRATYDLETFDKKILKWVFKITCAGTSVENDCLVNNTMCKTRFRTVLESDDAGGLGKAYCVVDNTGGDGFGGRKGKPGQSGEGQVLVMEGKLDAKRYKDRPTKEGWLTYYFYKRTDGD